jgi:hypothetical protein
VVGVLCRHRRLTTVGLRTITLGAAESLKEGDRDKAARVGKSWVAGLVPVLVVLASDNVEEVSSREAKFLA